ncbi:AMP-binding protein [Streptomyces sp. NPDC059224]|uniref:AMP-binding protein n=1 Tax=Streptomyces sp. NPDC059224 TaxID=3346775 RepID=UPI0036A86FD9
MPELMSRTAVPRRLTAPHAPASFAAVVHRRAGRDDVTIGCHVSGDGTAGTGVVTVEPGDAPSFSVLADRTTAALDELPEASSAGAEEQEDVPETDYTFAYEADNLTLLAHDARAPGPEAAARTDSRCGTHDPARRAVSALNPATEAENRGLRVLGHDDGTPPPPPRCVHELVAERAAATPEAPAVSRAGRVLTYGELDARAEQPAVRRRAAGLGQQRSPELVVTLLSILETGGAYLVLDPEDPAERQARLVRDAGAVLLIAEDGLGDRALADLGGEQVPSLIDLTLGILHEDIEAKRYHLPDPPRLPVAIPAIGWSRDFEVPYRSMGGRADFGTTDFEVLEDERYTFTEAHAALPGVFSAGLLPTAAEHLR